MTEFPETFAREWIEFPNPEDPKQLFKCDLTWLTSRWNCIFGAGCKGIDKEFPNHGCCSDGAYYFSQEDEVRTTKAASRLTPDMWDNYEVAHKGKKISITEIGLDIDRKTKKVNSACIFFNSNPKYFGCALHHLALKEEIHFAETKPDICWQLPLRRTWENREVGDDTIEVIEIGEYTRNAWGEGGVDMDWYCTSNTEAHTGSQPLYISNKTELIKLMNEKAYEILAEHCDRRIKALSSRKTRNIPLYVIHPASR